MNGAQQVQYPKTTLELLKYIAKKIPERLLKALPLTIIIGGLMWLAHTFLLVYTNEGFNPQTWLGRNVLGVSGKLVSSTLLWTMLGIMLPMIINFFRKGGNPAKYFSSMFRLPFDIVAKNKASGGKFLPIICFTAAILLFMNGILSGVATAFIGGFFMSSTAALITGRGSIFIQVIRMILTDIQMFVLKKKSISLDNESVSIIMGASGTILLLFGILKAIDPISVIFIVLNWTWAIFLILGVVLLIRKQNSAVPEQFMFLFGIFSTALLASIMFKINVSADDGGWYEAGGTFIGWVTSEGAIPASLMGLPPAIGGLIGAYVSAVIGGLFTGLGPATMEGPFVDPTSTTTSPTGTDPSTSQTQTQTTNDPAQEKTPEQIKLEQEEAERQRLEDERIRREFEERRRAEIEAHQEEKRKALAELKKIELQKLERQKYINSLCNKYGCTPENLRSVIAEKMGENAADAASWNRWEKGFAAAEAAARLAVVVSDTAIDGLANISGPAGRGMRAGYKIVKGTCQGASEAYAGGKSVGDGALSGLVKGGTDAATDFTESAKLKAALTIGGEVIGGAITDGREGAINGLKNGVYNATVNAVTDKIGGGGYGNDVALVNQGAGKTAVIISTGGGKTFTRIVTNNTAANFIGSKLTNQAIQTGVKGTSGLMNEFVIKPALTDYGILPK